MDRQTDHSKCLLYEYLVFVPNKRINCYNKGCKKKIFEIFARGNNSTILFPSFVKFKNVQSFHLAIFLSRKILSIFHVFTIFEIYLVKDGDACLGLAQKA